MNELANQRDTSPTKPYLPLEKVDMIRNHTSIMDPDQSLRKPILDRYVQILLHLCFCPLWPDLVNEEHGIIDLRKYLC